MHVAISGLAHSFRRRRVLDGVDAEFGPGVFGLLGPNGAGKTTLIRLLAGVLRVRTGRVSAGGLDLRTRAGRRALRRVLGYLPQHAALYPDLTPRDFLGYAGLLKGMDDPRERRRRAGELLDRLDLVFEADRRIGTLSAGTRRRVGIAQALLGDPALVLLDEPTAGLDVEERIRLRALLAGLGAERTVLLSTHLLDDAAALCPEVAVLAGGRTVYTGAAAGLAEVAADRVFLLSGPDGAPGRRIVTGTPPPGARPAAPTLEDGYAALMADVRAEPPA
ncbi:ATP-binding cassette domain-containing protein [Nocardiopsis composta]|uniref:ABC-type multidrug transport system ATPase subunit n=1 Tax=Nocardiopsis composta TaxID=157465 RepID=A0A7W8VH61_9ACTN|nr:ATP-binding cassette domain-containing protein [Nocardiopsis composta]MBB5435699.1 ABC-type multidrug transport system ATPase subunit [Nocardiopsis composta]